MPRYSCIYVALKLLGSFSLISLIDILEIRYYRIIIFEDSVSYTMLQNCILNSISAPKISLIVLIRENVIRVKFDRQSKIKKQSSERGLIVIRVTIRIERWQSFDANSTKGTIKYCIYIFPDLRIWVI